jgi:chromosome partitioning protein
VRANLNPKLRVSGVVLCMHDHQATHTREVVADMESFFEDSRSDADSPWRYARVFRPPIRRNIKLAEGPSFGQTIFDYAPDAAGAKDYEALGSGLLREWDRLLERRNVSGPEVRVTEAGRTVPAPEQVQ